MKKVMLFVSVLGLMIFVWGQSTKSPAKSGVTESQNLENKCSPEIEGLQFCTKSSFVSVKSGDSVLLNLSLQNMTDRDVTIVNGSLDSYYNVVITDSKGNKIYSFLEELKKKVDEGKIPLDELIKSLPVNTLPKSVVLSPKQELNLKFNLSQFYNLKAKDKYCVEISRKVLKENGLEFADLSFGTIEVEIK